MTDTKANQPEEITDVPGGKESMQKVLEAFIDTKDSGMGDKFTVLDEIYAFPYNGQTHEDTWRAKPLNVYDAPKYYSESYLQSRIAEAEERQREILLKIYDDLLMRAELAEDGIKEVNLSNGIWQELKAILNAGGQDDE